MIWCRSLPLDVRGELDRAAVRASRAGLGRYRNEVYRRFHVTGEKVACCTVCSAVVRGGTQELQGHVDASCRPPGTTPTSNVSDVGLHFTAVPGSGNRHRCVHCGKVFTGKSHRKTHMVRCNSLPLDVRGVLDLAAVRKSHAGLGRYCNVVYRRFHVTGEGVASCKECRAVVRGGTQELQRHVDAGCGGGGSADGGGGTAGAGTGS